MPTTVSSTLFCFFNDTATTEIYTLSLHDALPISCRRWGCAHREEHRRQDRRRHGDRDRKSTRLNSSHANLSYAVFCLKKKKNRLERDSTAEETGKLALYRIQHAAA